MRSINDAIIAVTLPLATLQLVVIEYAPTSGKGNTKQKSNKIVTATAEYKKEEA